MRRMIPGCDPPEVLFIWSGGEGAAGVLGFLRGMQPEWRTTVPGTPEPLSQTSCLRDGCSLFCEIKYTILKRVHSEEIHIWINCKNIFS